MTYQTVPPTLIAASAGEARMARGHPCRWHSRPVGGHAPVQAPAGPYIHITGGSESAMERWSLTALADGLLAHVGGTSGRHRTFTIHGGRPHPLRQTVIALAAGQKLDRHEHAGEATVQVLRGRVLIAAGHHTTDAVTGHLLVLSDVQHTIAAVEDTVLLLIVVERDLPGRADPGGHQAYRSRTRDATAGRAGPRRHRRPTRTTFEGKASP